METIKVQTARREELVDITALIQEVILRSGVQEGVAHLWSFHTTCGITVNEGADPDVARDIAWKLGDLIPREETAYRHAEGNSDSHVKTSLVNPGATLLINSGELALGTWQSVFLAEFDGPRVRKVGVQIAKAG
ncbi:MAG: YjbQ family protein [Gemmatimonadota bacterium]|nr:MAG: YjbQ family protein [Gemmatimonadota bacterium]